MDGGSKVEKGSRTDRSRERGNARDIGPHRTCRFLGEDLDPVHVDLSAPLVARFTRKHGDGLVVSVPLQEVVHRGHDVAHEVVVNTARVVVPNLRSQLFGR
jgi:hypothetical protein